MMAAKKSERVKRPGVFNWKEDESARGYIIKRFTTIESLIDAIVCSYYFPGHKPPREFLEDLLYDDSFSFEMRRRTFEKILRREGAFSEKFMQANLLIRWHDVRHVARGSGARYDGDPRRARPHASQHDRSLPSQRLGGSRRTVRRALPGAPLDWTFNRH